MDLFERLADVAERWNVLRHPFYQRWECGELSREELAFYAGEYRHAVVALARQAVHAGADHAAEEAAHVGVWDDFAAALGADLERPPTAETKLCAEAWTAGADQLERTAVLFAIESAQPEISRTKLDGLVEHYGFAPDDPAVAYFVVHAERDHDHAEESARVLAGEATSADVDRLVAAAEGALRGNWALLDGVRAA